MLCLLAPRSLPKPHLLRSSSTCPCLCHLGLRLCLYVTSPCPMSHYASRNASCIFRRRSDSVPTLVASQLATLLFFFHTRRPGGLMYALIRLSSIYIFFFPSSASATFFFSSLVPSHHSSFFFQSYSPLHYVPSKTHTLHVPRIS